MFSVLVSYWSIWIQTRCPHRQSTPASCQMRSWVAVPIHILCVCVCVCFPVIYKCLFRISLGWFSWFVKLLVRARISFGAFAHSRIWSIYTTVHTSPTPPFFFLSPFNGIWVNLNDRIVVVVVVFANDFCAPLFQYDYISHVHRFSAEPLFGVCLCSLKLHWLLNLLTGADVGSHSIDLVFGCIIGCVEC